MGRATMGKKFPRQYRIARRIAVGERCPVVSIGARGQTDSRDRFVTLFAVETVKRMCFPVTSPPASNRERNVALEAQIARLTKMIESNAKASSKTTQSRSRRSFVTEEAE